MKLRTGEPWMPAAEYGRTLKGLSINLLVKEVETALQFQREVLGVEVIYADPDFAVLTGYGAEWMFHADHTYQDHELEGFLTGGTRRGIGIELRLHGCDPDRSEEVAQRVGYQVLVSARNTGHGLREAYIADRDGYVWVPDIHML